MQEPMIADGKCVPCSPYAAAKWAGAAYASMFHEVFGLPVVVVRPFMVYGPGQPAGKVIPYIIRSFLEGERPKIGPGSQGVDWIYIDDVVRGLLEAATAKGVEGRTLELGSGRAVPLSVVVDEIAALVPTARRPEFGTVSRPLEQLKVADAEATWRMLGWRAEVSIREGLRRTVAYWRAAASTDRPAAQGRLMGGVGAICSGSGTSRSTARWP
jgi:nucleoside-diphosphate-sugar epimerase